MATLELLSLCKKDYDLNKPIYQKMQDYYDGNGKTDALVNYKMITSRANNKIPKNMVQKFVLEEVAFCIANGIGYTSHSSDPNIIEDIRLNITKSWSEKHEDELLKQALIFSKSYELVYLDAMANFKAMICNPLNSYILQDDFGNVQLFIRFFQKKFDLVTIYADVYEGQTITHYQVDGTVFAQIGVADTSIFSGTPVTICDIGSVYESIFANIKGQQDGYETTISNYINEISDSRNSILVTTGTSLEPGEEDSILTKAIMEVPVGGDVKWLFKVYPDNFIQNALAKLDDDMFSIANHIDHNQQAPSNQSSLAQKNKLMGLSSKCAKNINSVQDAIKTRIKFLFEFLQIKQSKNYSYLDVDIIMTVSIPSDDYQISQILSQNTKIPTRTGLSLYSFVTDVDATMKLYEEEQKANSVGNALLNGGV